MIAIIFGANSQDGFYLSRVLSLKKIKVIAVSRSEGDWIKGNINNLDFVATVIKQNKPDFIFHLAANSTTKHETLFENHETISTGTLNILESVKLFSPASKVFITGSGVQFQNIGKPIKETDGFDANSAYSIARIQSVYAARYYRSVGLKVYVGYLFHHESPLRKDHHISKLTTNFIKSFDPKSNEKLILGDIKVKKEWAYAEDIAEGIFALINQDQIFEACIGTGISYSIEDWLKQCFAIKNLNYINHIQLSNTPFKAEYNELVSDTETIEKTGWKAKTKFNELVTIMMA